MPLLGHDNRGSVVDAGDVVLRCIIQDYLLEAADIYNKYQQLSLYQYGVVETEFLKSEQVLKHKKHVISYPFEWTANMFKDAALFHLSLLKGLDEHGLTLKDALPSNILFDFSRPVFVDFFSIVFKDKLRNELWLLRPGFEGDIRCLVMQQMFMPFFLIPLLLMGRKDYVAARGMLLKRFCNSNQKPPSWRDLWPTLRGRRAFLFRDVIEALRLRKLMAVRNGQDLKQMYRELIALIGSVDVIPPQSGYSVYYEQKKEALAFEDQSGWQDKQKNVCSIIRSLKPKRVLDIGANTGWFSILAESEGAEVVAADIDESAADLLYLKARANKLRILPLKLSFSELEREIYGPVIDEEAYTGKLFLSQPLFLPATTRLKSDLVLCLGLFHHLTLGEGRSIDSVVRVLSGLGGDLVLEFVDLEDDLIRHNPGFFRNLTKYTPATYNIEIVLEAGWKWFKSIVTFDSHPNTRKLLLLRKSI